MADKGRLIKESNPANPRNAGFIPQHDSDGNENYVGTSPKNPFPVYDRAMMAELGSIKSIQKNIIDSLKNTNDTLEKVIKDGAVNTQVTGSIVEKVLFEGAEVEKDSYTGGYLSLDCPYYSIGILLDAKSKVDLYINHSNENNYSLEGLQSIIDGKENNRFFVKKTNADSAVIQVRLYNRNDNGENIIVSGFHLYQFQS